MTPSMMIRIAKEITMLLINEASEYNHYVFDEFSSAKFSQDFVVDGPTPMIRFTSFTITGDQ